MGPSIAPKWIGSEPEGFYKRRALAACDFFAAVKTFHQKSIPPEYNTNFFYISTIFHKLHSFCKLHFEMKFSFENKSNSKKVL